MRLAAGQRFDAILLDLFMPGMDGLTVLPLLRALAPETGIVIVSAFIEPDRAAEALPPRRRRRPRQAAEPRRAAGLLPRPDRARRGGVARDPTRAPRPIDRVPLLAGPAPSCLLFLGLGSTALTDRDEGANAEAAREMWERRAWLTPDLELRPALREAGASSTG